MHSNRMCFTVRRIADFSETDAEFEIIADVVGNEPIRNDRHLTEIARQDQTMFRKLWHWRVVELGYTPKNGKRWGECITAIFGDDYNEVLAEIPQAEETPGDFLVGNKTVSELDS